MAAIRWFQEKWLVAQEVRRQYGLPGLLICGSAFLIKPLYKRDTFYLYERPVKADQNMSESRPSFDNRELHFVVISSNAEADNLEKDGYSFRFYRTNWNYGLTTYRQWLDKGVIAFCTFVGKDFAAINWIVPSSMVQKRVTMPLKINYSGGEVLPRGAWVNPKYRGCGLAKYNVSNRDRFLNSKGVTLTRTTIHSTSKSGKGLVEALDSEVYGQAISMRILWWRFWKEIYDTGSDKF